MARYLNRGKKKYSADEKRAYWIGVGLSAAYHGDGEKLLNCSDVSLKRSFQSGYEADNHKDLSAKLLNRKK